VAGHIKRRLVIDEREVVYADPPNVSFLSFWGMIFAAFLLLPLLALYLIVWLIAYKLKIIKPERNPPKWGERRRKPERPL
jgi:hypothetical protein